MRDQHILAPVLASADETPAPATTLRNTTFFSTRGFIEAWSRSFTDHRPFAVRVHGSGPPRTMYGTQVSGPFALRTLALGPAGFQASPGWNGQLEISTLRDIVHALIGARTRAFVWNVRFDQQQLASGLESLGLKCRRTSTHVLHLERGYEEIFAAYNATMRNQVRKARRRGVRVRATRAPEDVRAYYEVHMRSVRQKGGHSLVFPVEFLLEMVKMHGNVQFLVAECEGKLAAGGLFLRDDCSVFYMHAAYDRDYTAFFPSCAVLDEAIRHACEAGAAFFNLGGSARIASLEQFKIFWGARSELNWSFTWENPFLARLSLLKVAIRKGFDA